MNYDEAQGLIPSLIQLLPQSPFKDIEVAIESSTGLAWLNWFFPVSECLTVMSAWLVAIGLYYAISVILRWVKIIGD